MGMHVQGTHTRTHMRSPAGRQVLLACGEPRANTPQNLTSREDSLTMVAQTWHKLLHIIDALTVGDERATGTRVVRANERMKPKPHGKVQMTSRRMPGGDATLAVWQAHVSQCESEHLLDS